MKHFPKTILKILLTAWGIVIILFLIVPEDNADEHYVQGISFFNKGQYDQAISEFSKAIRIEPRFTEAYRYRGLAYVKKVELDEAILNFTKAIDKDPRSTLDYIHRGNAYRAKGEYDLAISDYNKAIEIRPRSFDAYKERARIYEAKGEHDLATKDQNKATELEADYYYKCGEFLYERAKTYGKIREYDMAISHFTKAIEMHPKYSKAYVNRASVYFKKGKYEKAWEDVHKAQSLGYKVDTEFLKNLREASGKER